MAQFVPFEQNVEVLGQFIFTLVNATPSGKEYRLHILSKYGIDSIKLNSWYSQQQCLKAFEEISIVSGSNILFDIGKGIPEYAIFSPQIDSLEKALRAIDIAYAMNHRGGEIGYYDLIRFDSKARLAKMICTTPYPSEFDRGIITAMLKRFKPKDSVNYSVLLNLRKPTRLHGGDSCTYLIKW
jgi:hypothetical protein